MKIIIFTYFIISILCINFILCLRSGLKDKKYIIKRKPKIPEPNEWNVPQAPEMAYYAYPGIEWHMTEQIYNEMIPGEDLVQIETMIGKALPMNAALIARTTPLLPIQAGLIEEVKKLR